MTRTRVGSVFELAASAFPGWTDPDTGLRVLCLHKRGGRDEKSPVWATPYHQYPCFLDGGRRVMLRHAAPDGKRSGVLDLATGAIADLFPADAEPGEVDDRTKLATVSRHDGKHARACLWDLRTGAELAGVSADEYWTNHAINMVSDGRRAVVWQRHGHAYTEPVHSRFLLIEAGKQPRQIFEAHGFHCSHFQSCPADPELYAYDRWPSPPYPIEQAIHLRRIDGDAEEPLKLLPSTVRPTHVHGARDHFLWTPDGRWIVSYLFLSDIPTQGEFNHFEFDWWLSATDWRTGEDRAAKYPPGRWGGHMGVSPDSKQIICAGGPGYDKLFLVDIEKLKHGWNERVLCAYPKTVSTGKNSDPFPMPFALPDQSGVIFNAGWPGPEHGVYLCEWPRE